MKLHLQDKEHKGRVLEAFKEVVNSKIKKARWAVAYASLKGCGCLNKFLGGRVGESHWERVPKEFILSLDYGLTEPEALEFLSNLPHAKVWIANADVLKRMGFTPHKAFHPKIYLFDQPGKVGALAGSANLTEGGLCSNTEVVTTGFGKGEEFKPSWRELLQNTVPLTSSLLISYRKKRAKFGLLSLYLFF